MRAKRVFLFLCVCIFMIGCGLAVWCSLVERTAYRGPEYPMEDIAEILGKTDPGPEDYQKLMQQTGLGQSAVRMLWQEGRKQEMISLQQRFFAMPEMVCRPTTPFSREEKRVTQEDAPDFSKIFLTLEKGDILITFNSHVLGWRCGHAALVTDIEEGKTLEARVMGTKSAICSMKHWAEYPGVAVLRVKKLSREQREVVADEALKDLQGIPYQILSWKGALFNEEQEFSPGGADVPEISGTHCSHLIWTAYARAGVDLDSDGGMIVTPRDIFDSEELEVIQLYGMKRPKVNS